MTRAQARAMGVDVAPTPAPAAAATPATTCRTTRRGAAAAEVVPLAEAVEAAVRAATPVAQKLFAAAEGLASPRRAFGTPLHNVRRVACSSFSARCLPLRRRRGARACARLHAHARRAAACSCGARARRGAGRTEKPCADLARTLRPLRQAATPSAKTPGAKAPAAKTPAKTPSAAPAASPAPIAALTPVEVVAGPSVTSYETVAAAAPASPAGPSIYDIMAEPLSPLDAPTPAPTRAPPPASVAPVAPATPVLAPVALPASPAATLSPLPAASLHALPFVPRAVTLKAPAPAASASSGAPSLHALQKQYKSVLVDARARFPAEQAAAASASAASSASCAGVEEEEVSNVAPRAAPRTRVELLTAPHVAQPAPLQRAYKPRTYASAAAAAGPLARAAAASGASHDLTGLPIG
jgi:hypothetical protein